MTTEQPARMCSICLDVLAAGAAESECPSCHAVYHAPCWEWLGGCATYGCSRMVEVKKAEEGPAAFWGATEKKCPVCSETIAVEAAACPYCKTPFESAKPLSRSEFMKRFEGVDPEVRACRRNAIILLVFSALGCTSPVALLAGLVWYGQQKGLIEECGQTTKAIVFISFGVCGLYIVLLTFGMLVYAVRG